MAGSLLPDIELTDSHPMPTIFATRCPLCHTQFRVTSRQLAQREGRVRCGTCREIFNGTDYLSECDAPLNTDAHPDADNDAAGRMTLFDFGSLPDATATSSSTMQEELDALSKAIAELQHKPRSEAILGESITDELLLADSEDKELASPGFIQEARLRQRTGRLWTVLLVLGIPVLLLSLTAQLTYLFRNEIAAQSPQFAPYLRAACRRIACTITLPAQIGALSIESRQLQALPDQPDHFELIVLLRNLSTTSQAWPALDLQLNDAIGQAEIRKTFQPSEFLKASEIRTGIPAASEREIRLRFELIGDPAYGFNIRIFYL